jgi:hypothetical protein
LYGEETGVKRLSHELTQIYTNYRQKSVLIREIRGSFPVLAAVELDDAGFDVGAVGAVAQDEAVGYPR